MDKQLEKFVQKKQGSLGERLRLALELRHQEDKRLTQASLAKRIRGEYEIDIGASYVSKVVNSDGDNPIYPNADKIRAFCEILRINANWLLGVFDDPNIEYVPSTEGGNMGHNGGKSHEGVFCVTVSSEEERVKLQRMIELAADISVTEMENVINLILQIRGGTNRIRYVDSIEEKDGHGMKG